MSMLGPSAVHWASQNIGSGVYFNAMVDLPASGLDGFGPKGLGGVKIKYGVASTDSVHRDLIEWSSLYVAGRLHKPVETLVEDQRIVEAQQRNLSSAVRTAILLLVERIAAARIRSNEASSFSFSASQLFHTICSLSYTGDVRVGIAEDARKVDRILDGSRDRLLDMYVPILVQAASTASTAPTAPTASMLSASGAMARASGSACPTPMAWSRHFPPRYGRKSLSRDARSIARWRRRYGVPAPGRRRWGSYPPDRQRPRDTFGGNSRKWSDS
jgi:hypothetical protein